MLTSQKRIVLTTIIAAAVVVIVATFVFHGDGDATPKGQEVGGSEAPTARVQAVLKSLPSYPEMTVDDPGVRTEEGIHAFYLVGAKPEKAIAFYTAELPSRGWVMERAPTTETSEAKADGTQVSTLITTFIKNDLRMQITAVQNTKDPRRGATRLGVLVEPR